MGFTSIAMDSPRLARVLLGRLENLARTARISRPFRHFSSTRYRYRLFTFKTGAGRRAQHFRSLWPLLPGLHPGF